MLGNSLYMTNKLKMACALRADRRWLMTGTPTPGGPNSDTAHLQPLLAFLHNEPYGTEPSVWQVHCIGKLFKSYNVKQGSSKALYFGEVRFILLSKAA